ncbi:MAG: DUF4347 domain-containing protein [Nitrospira sp.]|nr:DUF4347 domain-containing protein [Nitrospira sp.]
MLKLFKKTRDAAATSQPNKKNPSSSSSVKQSLLSLEPRLMFDAAAAATASEVASEQVAQEQAEAAVSSDSAADGRTTDQVESQGVLDAIATYHPGESRAEVVFVDPTVPNYQELLSGMDPNIEVIMLDGGQDGVEQMATTLSGRSGIDAIHLISHGSAGQLQLGTGTLNADSMPGEYADELATIQQSLSEQADILVYGCDFAEGDTGQAAVNLLAELTGADVQASTDLTGHLSLGGDWEFEVSTGTIETALAVDYDAQMNWAGLLGTETVKDTFSGKSYANNNGTESWSSGWSERDADGGEASGGDVQINSGQLRIDTDSVGTAVSRGVDLSHATRATLTFHYTNRLSGGDRIELRVSTDGGANYQTLRGGIFSNTTNPGGGTASFDLSGYMSANTRIQFLVTGTGGGDRLFVDNVQVSYDTGVVSEAPTDLSLSANMVPENAVTGTVIGTVSSTDPDAGDAKTYSLTDTAGGRFAIDPTTGVLTVADGSLLNYERATTHTVTVQVTDADGQSLERAVDIHVTNIVETFVLSGNETLRASDGPFENVIINGGYLEIDGDVQIKGDLTITRATRINGGTLSVTGDVTTTDTSYTGSAVIVLAGDGPQTISTGGRTGELCHLSIANSSGQVTIEGALQLSGHYTDNGNTVDATGATVELQANARITAAATRFGDVTLNGGYLEIDGDVQIKGDLTITRATRINGGTLSVTGDVTTTDTSYTGSAVIVLAGDGPQTISTGGRTGELCHLSIANSSGQVTIEGALQLSGHYTDNGNTVDATGATVELQANARITAAATRFGDVTLNGGYLEIDGDVQIKGDLTITRATRINGGTLSVTGDVTTTDTSYTGSAVIVLAGDGPQTISTGGRTGELCHLSIANSSGQVTIEGALQLSGHYTDNGNTVDATGATVELQANARITAAATRFGDMTLNGRYLELGRDIYVEGDLTINNLVRLNGGTIYVAGQIAENDRIWSGTGDIQPWVRNQAPTDLALEGGTVVERAVNGSLVGTVSGTDPDAGDTTTYSLTDTAGGRFAIDPTTGVLTVADGRLLNYEAATTHTVTVRVTDHGGLSYDETFTIQVSNVNEATTMPLEGSTVDEGLVSSLFINAEATQSGSSQTVDVPSDHHNEVTEAESYLLNDAPDTAEANTHPVSTVEPFTTGHKTTQDTHEQVPIQGRDGQQAASPGIPVPTGVTDSTDFPDNLPQESGPWPWSQSDGVETAQNESAGLGLSMAVGLAGLVGQGSQGTKEKLMSVKAQLQALHQKNPSENTSQRAAENKNKEPAPEG